MGRLGKQKGSGYEGEICHLLSTWWTNGSRDDVFWKTGGSGNRAFGRAKKGLSTAGQHGDVAAVDSVGEALIDFATISIKRGYSRNTILDLFDCNQRNIKSQIWNGFVEDARTDSLLAGSATWMIITRRDKRVSTIWMPHDIALELFGEPPAVCLTLQTNDIAIFGTLLDTFFSLVKPSHIEKAASEL